jgi:lipopolysaccharide assembly outer membrane protein LptD (OstA)
VLFRSLVALWFPPAALSAASPSDTAAVDADLVVLDLDRDLIQAEGNAALSYHDLRLHSDHLTANQGTGDVEATGALSLVQAGRRLQGELLQYNVRTDRGVLTNARVDEQGIVIKGARIELSPQSLVAHDAQFTTCDLPEPHYLFTAGLISLTAERSEPGKPPQSGRLTLTRAHLTYHHRRLFALPSYSVSVSRIREPRNSPFPVTGFSRDDGPFGSVSYTLGKPEAKTLAELSYRYTTYRGIRGHLRLRRSLGPAELVAGYIRREDVADEDLHPDQIEYSARSVLVNRAPEYGIRLPELPIGRSLTLHGEWLRGTYSERYSRVVETRARADRNSVSALLSTAPYSPTPGLTLSHAIGWRHSSYSPGDALTISFYRHSLSLQPTPNTDLSLSYIARRGSGESPFLFDSIGIGRELLADLGYRLSPAWRVRLAEVYDLSKRETRDIDFSLTRTAHCLDYTVGWRKSRGSFFFTIGLAPLPVRHSSSDGG